MGAIFGRTYKTRGVRRFYREDSISIEPHWNVYHRIRTNWDRRDLLYLKDTNHLTDSAVKAIVQYINVMVYLETRPCIHIV
jgi:hypothetical protein